MTQVVADGALASMPPIAKRLFTPSGQAWPGSRAGSGLPLGAGWSLDLGKTSSLAGRSRPGQGARVRVGQGAAGTYFVLTLTASIEIEDDEQACAPPSKALVRPLRGVATGDDSPLGFRSLLRELQAGGLGARPCRSSERTADLFIEQVGSGLPPDRVRFALGTATDWREYPAGDAISLGGPIPLQTGLVHGQRVLHQIAVLVLDSDLEGYRQMPIRYTARLSP